MPALAHASIDTSDLDQSIRFYRVLLGEPTVTRSDYARFELSDPPFVISLVPAPAGRGQGGVNHLGIRLPDLEALERWAERLAAGGVPFERETEVECCYSRQTKLWVVDPDGTLWELYVRLGQVERAGRSRYVVTRPETATRRGWTHRLSDGVVDRVPAEDGTLDDVLLEGSLNARMSSSELAALLREAHRALRPGGTLRMHGLVASGPVPLGLRLPGPASAVEKIPVEAEPLLACVRAGFVDVRAEVLPDRPNFRAGGVELREILVVAERPAARAGQFLPVLYRGPFARVEDDSGQVYVRGERTWIDAARRQALEQGPLAEHFTFFEATEASAESCC